MVLYKYKYNYINKYAGVREAAPYASDEELREIDQTQCHTGDVHQVSREHEKRYRQQ